MKNINATIHLKWQQFTPKEQTLLYCLSPFQYTFYYDYEEFQVYLNPLKTWHQMPDNPQLFFYPLLQKMIRLGLCTQVSRDFAFLQLHPLFRSFLQQQVQKKNVFSTAIKHSFWIYYQKMGEDLYGRIASGNFEYYQEALAVLTFEYPNFLEAIWWCQKQQKDILVFLSIVAKIFEQQQKMPEWLSFLLTLKKRWTKDKTGISLENYICLLDDIGNTYLALRQPEKAEKNYLEALTFCEQASSNNAAIEDLKGGLYSNLGNTAAHYLEQIEWQEKAYKMAKKAKNNKRKGIIAYNLSEVFFQLRQLEKSKHYLQIAAQSFIKTGALSLQIKAHQSLAKHLTLEQQFKKAEENLQQALKIANSINDTYQTAVIYQELASLHYINQKPEQAIFFCKKAIPTFLQTNDELRQANVYNLLSAAAFKTNDFEEGLTYAMTALDLFYKTNDISQMAQTYGNIALEAYNIGDYEESLAYIQKSMESYAGIGQQFSVEKVRIFLAAIYWEMKEVELCKKELLQAFTYFVQVGNQIEMEHCWRLGHFIYQELKEEAFRTKMQNLANTRIDIQLPDLTKKGISPTKADILEPIIDFQKVPPLMKATINDLITQNKMKKAFAAILEQFPDNRKVKLFHNQWKDLEEEYGMGMMTGSEYRANKTKIVYNLLKLVDELFGG